MSEPRIPEAGEYVWMYGTLVEVQDVTPKEVVLDYIFENTEARVEARINGVFVREYSTYNNHYGKGTCVDGAIKSAKRQREFLGESNLEFVVIKKTSRVRMRPLNGECGSLHDPKFIQMDSLRHGSCCNLPDDVEEVVWSSLEVPTVEGRVIDDESESKQHDGFVFVETCRQLERSLKVKPDGYWSNTVTVCQSNCIGSGALEEPNVSWSCGGESVDTPHLDRVTNFIKALVHAREIAELWTQDVGKKLEDCRD